MKMVGRQDCSYVYEICKLRAICLALVPMAQVNITPCRLAFLNIKRFEINIIYRFVDTLEPTLTQHYISIRCLRKRLVVRLYVVEVPTL
jgi:hypothetical protein